MTDVTISTASTVVNEQSFGQSPVVGMSVNYAREDHTHGTPDNPVPIKNLNGPGIISRELNTIYQNTDTRGILVISTIALNPNQRAVAYIEVDTSNPPTVVQGLVAITLSSANGTYVQLIGYVPPNYYYRIRDASPVLPGVSIEKWYELMF